MLLEITTFWSFGSLCVKAKERISNLEIDILVINSITTSLEFDILIITSIIIAILFFKKIFLQKLYVSHMH